MRVLFAKRRQCAPMVKVGGHGPIVVGAPAAKPSPPSAMTSRCILPGYGQLWSQLPIRQRPHLARSEPWTQRLCDLRKRATPATACRFIWSAIRCSIQQRIYGGDDERLRFTFFANASAEFCWKPLDSQRCCTAMTWQQQGMLPAWMHTDRRFQAPSFTIHNLQYRGPGVWKLERMHLVPLVMQGASNHARWL